MKKTVLVPASLVFLYCLIAGALSSTWGCGTSSPRRAGGGGIGGGAGGGVGGGVGGAAVGDAANGGAGEEGGGASVGGHDSQGGTSGQMAGAGAEDGGGGAAGSQGGAGGTDSGSQCGDMIVCTVGRTRCVINDLQACVLDQMGCPSWISSRTQPAWPFPDCPPNHFICTAGIVTGCDCPTSTTDAAADSCGPGSN